MEKDRATVCLEQAPELRERRIVESDRSATCRGCPPDESIVGYSVANDFRGQLRVLEGQISEGAEPRLARTPGNEPVIHFGHPLGGIFSREVLAEERGRNSDKCLLKPARLKIREEVFFSVERYRTEWCAIGDIPAIGADTRTEPSEHLDRELRCEMRVNVDRWMSCGSVWQRCLLADVSLNSPYLDI